MPGIVKHNRLHCWIQILSWITAVCKRSRNRLRMPRTELYLPIRCVMALLLIAGICRSSFLGGHESRILLMGLEVLFRFLFLFDACCLPFLILQDPRWTCLCRFVLVRNRYLHLIRKGKSFLRLFLVELSPLVYLFFLCHFSYSSFFCPWVIYHPLPLLPQLKVFQSPLFINYKKI